MKEVFLLTFHWGWLSPGSYQQLRYDQGTGYLDYIKTLPSEYFSKLVFSHPGWLFDINMNPEVKSIPGQTDEATLNVLPFDKNEIAEWRLAVSENRLEPITYYYVPLVAEQVSGEMLIRAIRYSRTAIQNALGVEPYGLTSHDPFTLMNWGTAQQVQLAALTGHSVLVGGLEGKVRGLDGTELPCIGGTLQRYGLEFLATPMIQRLSEEEQVAFIFATEMHWHHRTNPYERALRQIALRFKNLRIKSCGVNEWIEHVQDWDEIPANGLGSKGWNGGGPDQFQLSRMIKENEFLLPGLEAINALQRSTNPNDDVIKTYWKRLLFLNDNHIRWFVHDHKKIFNPAANSVTRDIQAFTNDLLVEISNPMGSETPRLVVWNLLGWDRKAYAETIVELPQGFKGLKLRSKGEERPVMQITPLEWSHRKELKKAKILWEIRNLPAWGYRIFELTYLRKPKTERKVDETSPLTLENSRIKATFSENGEIASLEDKKNDRVVYGGNRILNLIPQPYNKEQIVDAGVPLRKQGEDFSGCFSASAEVILPEVATYHLHLDEMQGCFVLAEVDIIDRTGALITPTRRFPIINLHWMAAPHRHADGRNIPLGELAAGIRLRITLWFMSEGESTIGTGSVFSKRNNLIINRWTLRWNYRFEAIPGKPTKSEKIDDGPLRQTLYFQGELPQCTYETKATLLGSKQTRIDFETSFTFSEETMLGFPTPPIPPEIGSYFGSNNERPYIPGLAVTFPAPENPDILVDTPFAFRDPFAPVHPEIIRRTWLASETEQNKNFWWGLTPFSGLNYMLIRNWYGLIADGTPHFFLWHDLPGVDGTVFGLSFGSSLIHPRTVTKRISPKSDWFEFGRGPGYSDFQDGIDDYSFNHPKGKYVYRYSLSVEPDPIQMARDAREILVTPRVIAIDPQNATSRDEADEQALLRVDSKNLMLTGCELLETTPNTNKVRVRLVELSGKETTSNLTCHQIIEEVEQGKLPIYLEQVNAHSLNVRIPAHGVRELLLTLRVV